MKKIFFVLVVLISIPCKAFTYETNVHVQITSRAISLSTIEQYLSKNLNISLSDKFSDGINRRPASEWLELGGVWEDNTPRWLNHFYDPTTGLGLHDILSGKPSLQWAKDYANNEWDWNRARFYFYSALTSTIKTDREKNFAKVFRALGQLIHLVEDKAVPAHVRNDAHPYYFENYLQQQRDMYEKYTRDAVNDELNGTNRIPHLKYDGYSAVDLTIFNSLDFFWINSGKGLAEFTNRNFVSRDTNFDDAAYSNYNTPASIGEGITTERVYDPDYGWIYVNVKYLQGYATDNYRSGQSSPISRLSAFSYFDYEMNKYLGKPGVYSLNNYVHQDYASLLIPRAVGYSAGLLDYFFRGEMDMIKDPNNPKQYIIKNLSNENMFGTFSLYYDDTNNNRYLVASWENLAINANSQSSAVTFTAPSSPAPKEKGKYILVFQGTLGNEIGAVMGKVVEGLCAGQWVQIGGCWHMWGDHMGNMCFSYSETIDGKYKYGCVSRYGSDCWTEDKCVDSDGNCITRAWCDEHGKTVPPCEDECCKCNDYNCDGIMSNVTQSPCYHAPLNDQYGPCFIRSATVYEWQCQ